MNGDLPEGWATAPLDLLCKRLRGVSYTRDEVSLNPKKDFVPILRANNIESDRLVFEELVYAPQNRVSDAQRIRKGDVVIAMSSGSKSVVGKTAQAMEKWDGAFGAFCGVLRPSPELNSRYFGLFLRTRDYRHRISELSAGTNINNLKSEHFAEIEVPIAPVAEQTRIVAKLDMLLAKVDTCEQRLAKVPALLKRFRQSVLDAACSGRLTEDWREENSASAVADDLPNGWSWSPLQRFLPKGGIFDGPFGSNLKTSDYTGSGVRVIRLENIGQLSFFEEKQTFISQKKYASLKKHTVREGDIIFASFISEEVRACVLPKLSTKAIAKADCFCLRPDASQVDPKYLVLQLVSRQSYDRLFEEVHGATRPRINTTQLRNLPVRTCPLPEQQEIVCRVEKLFALADQVEARFAEAKKRVDSITQSILAKAFSGELVPAEYELAKTEGRSFESAEKLLKRIGEDGRLAKEGKRRSPGQ